MAIKTTFSSRARSTNSPVLSFPCKRESIRPSQTGFPLKPRAARGKAGMTMISLLFFTSVLSMLAADLDGQAGQNTLYGVAERIRGFDPVTAGDVAGSLAIGRIYEGLLQYSYLIRPYQVEPNLSEKLPDISADGLVYTFTIRRGIYFQDDTCFTNTSGKGRELTADDFIYAIKRVADLKTGSTGYWAFNNRIRGLDEFRNASAGEQATDYGKKIEGLSALDRYTLQIRLKEPYPQLLWILTMHYTFAVPHEAVEYYGQDFVNHPVGTGPFRLKSWTRNYRIEYEINPKWQATGRVERYPVTGAEGDSARGLLVDAGKPIPFIDRIVQYVINDSTTLWFLFLKGQLESSGISRDNWDAVITSEKKLNQELAAMGIRMYSTPVMETYYIGFNMDDPVVGPNKILRQALACAFNTEEYLRFYNHRVIRALGPIPPGISGFQEQNQQYPFNLELARKLLAQAGYPDGKDPETGRRLKLNLDVGNANDPEVRASVELFSSFMEKIGVQINPVYNNWPTFLARLERRQAQMFRLGWVADYPDAENFLQLFYGPNSSPGPNHCNYRNKTFDELYEQVRIMADSPERTALYRQMTAIVVEDSPWIFEQHPLAYGLSHHWLKNYKPHDFPYGMNKYHKIDYQEREEWQQEHKTK
jgi:ABC-type transport system substrate-binding protein